MPTRFAIDEQVWVPSSLLSGEDPAFSLVRRRVRGQDARSVIVDDRNGAMATIASRRVHHNTLGFLVLRIGDLQTEVRRCASA